MKFKFLITFILTVNLSVSGQVINNLSSDKTNIYYHAYDSTVNIIRQTEKFKSISVVGDKSVLQNFPDSLDNIKLIKLTNDLKKIPKIKDGEIRTIIKDVQIIRDQFKIPILTWGHNGRLADGLFVFRYQYVPETKTYQLKDIKKGIEL
jgi:hypothetical protein